MPFHQFFSPCCAVLGVALPLSYSSGRLIGYKLETWRRLGIKALVAPRSAIHHCMTVHWSGGTVEKPTGCFLMRGLTLVHSSPPTLKQSSPPPHLFFLISASLGGGDCSRWSTQALSPANCLRFRRFRSALLIKAGQRQLGNINMMKALTKSLFKLRRNESWWAPLARDQRGCLWISRSVFAVKLHLQLKH